MNQLSGFNISKDELSYVCTDQLLTLESLVRKESLADHNQSPFDNNNYNVQLIHETTTLSIRARCPSMMHEAVGKCGLSAKIKSSTKSCQSKKT